MRGQWFGGNLENAPDAEIDDGLGEHGFFVNRLEAFTDYSDR